MVQSDVPKGRTQSGKVNTKWYLERLRVSAIHHSNDYEKFNRWKRINSNSTIRVVRGSTATQGQHIPRVYLTSPIESFQIQTNEQKSSEKRSSTSIVTGSAISIKSTSTKNETCPSSSELNCKSYQSMKTYFKNEKENVLLNRRSSSERFHSVKSDLIARPPSTPVDPRCQRDYSSGKSSLQRETCRLLGPQLCSDCIEVQTRSNLSTEHLPNELIRQRLSALAIRSFIPNEENLTDEDFLQLINNEQIQLIPKSSNPLNNSIISDEEYFHRLSLAFKQSSKETPFYFKDFKDFSYKYQTNQYPRLFLSETPAPQSSNPIFEEGSFEKFGISPKYSSMKRASTIKPNLRSNANLFISPKHTEQFYRQHRFLINYSPPLLKQTTSINSKLFSSSSIQQNKFKRSLINHRSSLPQTIQT